MSTEHTYLFKLNGKVLECTKNRRYDVFSVRPMSGDVVTMDLYDSKGSGERRKFVVDYVEHQMVIASSGYCEEYDAVVHLKVLED